MDSQQPLPENLNETFDFIDNIPPKKNSFQKMVTEHAIKQLTAYKRQSLQERELSLIDEFKEHLKNHIGTLDNFPKKNQLLQYLEQHPDEMNIEDIKAISASKINNFHEALFQQIFLNPNKAYFFNAPLIKAFENIMNGKPTDFQEQNNENSGNFIIQNFRDDVENSNPINTLPKKPIDQLLKDEEKAKSLASEKYSDS